MSYQVLVLCYANRWRSPLAAGCIEREVNILVPDHVQVCSAGFKEAGKPAGKPVRNVALELGFTLEHHKSTTCTQQMIQAADLVVYMDNGNYRRLCQLMGIRQHNRTSQDWRNLGSFCLPARTRIEDLAFISPRTNPEKFDEVVRYIDHACRTLVETVIAPEARKRQA